MKQLKGAFLAVGCCWLTGCQLAVPQVQSGAVQVLAESRLSPPSVASPVPVPPIPQQIASGPQLAEHAVTTNPPIAPTNPPAGISSAATGAPVPPAVEIARLDLATTLSLASGRSVQAAFARARVEEAYGQLDRARALKLPSLRAGLNYNKHEGRIQDVAGSVIETSRGSFYGGLGAGAVGAGSPATPGLIAQFHVADAVFQPRIAALTVQARRQGARAAQNDALLSAGVSYMELLRAEQELAICDEVVRLVEQLERTTGDFAKSGAGTEADYDRARTELALRRCEQLRAEEAAAAASARLAEQVRWDQPTVLKPADPRLVPVELVSGNESLQQLVSLALTSRPELAECRYLVGEAVERLNRERQSPLIPSVLLSASYGGLAGGLGSDLRGAGDRLDADAMAYWELRQLGFGEQAVQRESRARISQARARQLQMMDRVAREVTESFLKVTSGKQQMETAVQAVDSAELSYQKNLVRIQNGQGLPLEALQSLQALAVARREYARSIADYNIAQLTLQRAAGFSTEAH
ncbi:MAG: TolC family protein [Planctomycetota bacterium]